MSSFDDIPQTFYIEIFKSSLSLLTVMFSSDSDCKVLKVIILSHEVQQPSTHTRSHAGIRVPLACHLHVDSCLE